jgi:hypothetical protein
LEDRHAAEEYARYEGQVRALLQAGCGCKKNVTQFDVNEADKSRRFQLPNTRLGGEPRFPPEEKKYKITPGPQYDPCLRPEVPKNPEFSLYARRSVKGFDPLIQLNSTPPIVGPGSYHPESSANPSNRVDKPAWSIPKGPRLLANRNKWDLNQTYDTTPAVGNQVCSMKRSMPHFSAGREKRDNPSGIFKEHMSFRAAPVRIPHPRW